MNLQTFLAQLQREVCSFDTIEKLFLAKNNLPRNQAGFKTTNKVARLYILKFALAQCSMENNADIVFALKVNTGCDISSSPTFCIGFGVFVYSKHCTVHYCCCIPAQALEGCKLYIHSRNRERLKESNAFMNTLHRPFIALHSKNSKQAGIQTLHTVL